MPVTFQYPKLVDPITNTPIDDPTIEAGDFTYTLNGVTANLATLPTKTATGFDIVISDAENIGGSVIKIEDQTDPAEWRGPGYINIDSDPINGDTVLVGTTINGTDGTVVLPSEADVREGETYGANSGRTGTLDPSIVESQVEGVTSGTTLELINGDKYDGVYKSKLSWSVSKDYTGKSIKLVVYDKHDTSTIAGRFDGVVDSSTVVSVSLEADFSSGDVTITYEGCPLVCQLGFALVAYTGSDEETIARGSLYLYDRGTIA